MSGNGPAYRRATAASSPWRVWSLSTGRITHLAFYAGRPAASTAVEIARKVFEEIGA
jgi:hypothetical protein